VFRGIPFPSDQKLDLVLSFSRIDDFLDFIFGFSADEVRRWRRCLFLILISGLDIWHEKCFIENRVN